MERSLSPAGIPFADIRDVSVDPKLPKAERIAEFLRQIKNPYCFKCGKFTVRVQFADNGVSLRVDDGYSGVLLGCPAFQEIMNDIVSGKINCVIVKELFRLGREHIETGRYFR